MVDLHPCYIRVTRALMYPMVHLEGKDSNFEDFEWRIEMRSVFFTSTLGHYLIASIGFNELICMIIQYPFSISSYEFLAQSLCTACAYSVLYDEMLFTY